MSETPAAISMTAWRNAACELAQAASNRVVGIVGMPRTEAAWGPMCSCFSVSLPTTLP
jgi:hypothetical protein